MKRTIIKTVLILAAIAVTVAGSYWLLRGMSFDILQPGGHIARREMQILVFTVSLAAIIVIPVFAMLFIFGWRYRDKEGNKAVYKPDWAHNTLLEVVWWGIPILIILILAVMTWITTHELDPYRKLDKNISDAKPLEVQVIALEWKWLFIYPEEGVASAGQLVIPANRPINFTITSDAPMNSFWIPKLGGQIYAMSAMSTELSLIADKPGEYRGYSSNISGEGFAGMKFIAHAKEQSGFDDWVAKAREKTALDLASYNQLAEKSVLDKPRDYALADDQLYDKVVDKYMLSDSQYYEKYHQEKSAIHDDSNNEKNMHEMDRHTKMDTNMNMDGMDMKGMN